MPPAKPVLPVPGERNILITSALPYVNAIPHLGNLIGSVLSADTFARYCRARGLRTLFICGSDQYGTASEAKATIEGVTPAELCAKYHALHEDIYKWFRIQFDIFGQTPTSQQTQIVQDISRRLWANGFIEERETEQPFCPVHSSFLADRFIEGECSICGYADARGDQCDKCGNLLDPLEPESKPSTDDQQQPEPDAATVLKATGWLLKPRCKLDGATPERRKTKHLFLRLDTLTDDIISWYDTVKSTGGFTANALSITQSWIDKGLQPRAITRDLRWGVPIATLDGLSDEEYKKKVWYCWYDAPLGYVSITKCYTDEHLEGKNWEQWWKNPKDVELFQFMGKDNVPFHSIIFPASQLGTNESWTQVRHLSATEYLNYEGGKFSKSRGVGVFGNDAKDTGIDPDIWRFYLLSRRPETGDTEFKWDEFILANNSDLLKNLGNFVQRVVKFCNAKMGGIVPRYQIHESHKAEVNVLLQTYLTYLDAIKLRLGLATVLQISALGNKFLQDHKLDNRLFSEEPERCATVIGMALNQLHLLASILSPYMPKTAESIFQQLGADPVAQIPDIWDANALSPGHTIGEAKSLFTTIPTSKLEEWREAFGGAELRKQKILEAEKAAAKKAAKKKGKEEKLQRKSGTVLPLHTKQP